MNKLAYIVMFFLFVLIIGCKNTNETQTTIHQQEVSATPSIVAVPTTTPIASLPEIEKSKQAQDIEVRTDFKSWDHPVKTVFDKYNLHPFKMELTLNNTFPTFYFDNKTSTIRSMVDSNESYYGQLLRKISEANGYWDYKMVMQDSKMTTIEVSGDREAHRVRNIKVNGVEKKLFSFAEDDDLYRAQEEKLRTVLLSLNPENMHLLQIRDIDLDQDGMQEKLVSFGKTLQKELAENLYYILQKNETSYRQIDLNNGSVGWLNDMEIIHLNDGGQPYIYLQRTNGSGQGFNLYKMEKGKLIDVDRGFPPTGVGYRAIEKGADGHYMKKTVEEFVDRVLEQMYRWDGNSFVKSSSQYKYNGFENQNFNYPDTPEKVLYTYLLDVQYLQMGDDDKNTIQMEIQQLVSNKSLIQFDIKPYNFNFSPYYETELKTVRVEDRAEKVLLETANTSKKLLFELLRIDGIWKINSITDKK